MPRCSICTALLNPGCAGEPCTNCETPHRFRFESAQGCSAWLVRIAKPPSVKNHGRRRDVPILTVAHHAGCHLRRIQLPHSRIDRIRQLRQELPGPLAVTTHRRRGQHRFELACVSEGELPQHFSDRRGRIHTVKQCLHPASVDHVDVIDAVRTRAHPRRHRRQLRRRVRRPRLDPRRADMDLSPSSRRSPVGSANVITGTSPRADLSVAVGRVYSGRMSSVA
jgi:hypothetical protein